MLHQDVTMIAWEERVPGPKNDISLSELAKPWFDNLKDVISYLPDNSERLRGEQSIRELTNILEFQDVLKQQQQIQHEKQQADLAEATSAMLEDLAERLRRLTDAVESSSYLTADP